MHDQLLLDTQRRLRRRLFEGPDAIAWRPARELAAQLLLYLDDPAQCWQIAAEWLRDTLDADRVDGGWGGWVGADGRSSGYVVLAEARRTTLALPSVAAQLLGPVLAASQRLAVETIEMDGASPPPGPVLTAAGAGDAGRPDWAPAASTPDDAPNLTSPLAAALTPAERRVALLVAQGLSYKEIARRLDRSLSTVDHQLRSIRTKLGVRSTSRLVHLLSEQPSSLR